MAKAKLFSVSVLADVTVYAVDKQQAIDKVARALFTACRNVKANDVPFSLHVQGIEYQNNKGQIIFEDLRP